MRIWFYTRKKTRIDQQFILQIPDDQGDFAEIVAMGCEQMKLPRPMVLSLHEKDYADFHFATFKAEVFVESVPFDDLVVRQIIDKQPDGRPRHVLTDA